jgi:hypothetical protein
MANTSIYAAFERMWQHITIALSNKPDKADLDRVEELVTQKAQVQFIDWEDEN